MPGFLKLVRAPNPVPESVWCRSDIKSFSQEFAEDSFPSSEVKFVCGPPEMRKRESLSLLVKCVISSSTPRVEVKGLQSTVCSELLKRFNRSSCV